MFIKYAETFRVFLRNTQSSRAEVEATIQQYPAEVRKRILDRILRVEDTALRVAEYLDTLVDLDRESSHTSFDVTLALITLTTQIAVEELSQQRYQEAADLAREQFAAGVQLNGLKNLERMLKRAGGHVPLSEVPSAQNTALTTRIPEPAEDDDDIPLDLRRDFPCPALDCI